MLTDKQIKETESVIDNWWNMLDRNMKHEIYTVISNSLFNDSAKNACDKTYDSLNKIYRANKKI